jgi:hypothetical protein
VKWLLLLVFVFVFVVGIGEREIWRRQIAVRGIAGDSLQYFKLAHGLKTSGTLAFDDRTPAWTRLPGYPILLWSLGIPDDGDARGFARWLTRAEWLNLALDLAIAGLIVLLAGWKWGGIAWLLQPWGTVFSALPLSDVAAAFLSTACLVVTLRAKETRHFVAAGALAAAALYVRSDAILLIPVMLLGARRWKHAAASIVTVAVLFSAWPIRNLIQFGEPHLLGGGGNIDVHGGYFDRSALMAWMRTWAAGERATVDVGWRFPFRPIHLNELPREAYDEEDRAELSAILERYDALGAELDPDLQRRWMALANARMKRHPLKAFVILPLVRMAKMLFPPRDGYGLNALPMLSRWRWLYSLLDGALVIFALVALARSRNRVLLGFLALRLLLVGWMPTAEPRYFLPALPILYAVSWKRNETS